MKQLKFIFALFGLSFLLFSFSNCGGAQTTSQEIVFEEEPPFTIGEAYSQDWVAGVQSGGAGTNVYINFNPVSEGVVFKKVYIKKKVTELQSSPNVRTQYIGRFKKETNRNVIMDGEVVNEAKNTPPVISPFDLKDGEAVISYLHNDTLKYCKITNMERKEIIAYPSTNNKGID